MQLFTANEYKRFRDKGSRGSICPGGIIPKLYNFALKLSYIVAGMRLLCMEPVIIVVVTCNL